MSKEKIKLSDYISTIWRTIKIANKNFKFKFWAVFFLGTIEVVSTVAAAYFGGNILGEVVKSIQAGQITAGLKANLLAEFGTLIIVNFSSSLQMVLDREVFIGWDKWFTMKLNEARVSLDLEFYEDRENQKLLNKIDRKGGWALANLSEQIYYSYYNILKIILISGSIFSVGWWVPLILTATSIPRIMAELRRSKLSWGVWDMKGDEYHRHYKTINLFSEVSDIIEIKLFGLKNKLLYGIAAKNIDKFNDQQINASRSTMKIDLLSHLVYETSFLGITFYFAKSAISGAISIANFGFFTAITNQFSTSLRNLSSIISRSSEFVLYAKDLYKVLDSNPKITNKKDAVKVEKGHIPEIEFRDVGFAYKSNKKTWVLRHLNFKIKPGEHLALVGENGAGKTTIIKLVLRLYDVDEGEILLDGVNIKDIDLDTYWRAISVLFQEFNRYPFDIKTNVEFGRVRAKSTKLKIDRALDLADMSSVLKKMPSGINTILDNSFEEGIEPSGGQWQRVALARAFYREGGILILDEPTAAVDANAEYKIFNNIFKSYKNKTTIIISHRFSTVRRADRIIVLQKGKIIEEGTHQSLIKKAGLYGEMFNKQAEGYKD